MSRQRLEALLEFLTSRRWELLTPDEYPDASVDPFRLEGEEIVWAVRRVGSPTMELRFWAIEALGGHTNDLRDLFCCNVAGAPEIRLYFSKINTARWHEDLRQFIWNLEAFARAGGVA